MPLNSQRSCIRSRPRCNKDAKIHKYRGVLVKLLLGLSTNDFKCLSQMGDLTIHLGAEVPPSSFWPPAAAESLMKNAIGYATSRWMGKILLKRVEGLPAAVHRFPNIIRPDAPEEIPLVALDRYYIKMRAVPALDPSSGSDSLTSSTWRCGARIFG